MFLPPGHIRNFEELVALLGDCWTRCLARRDIGGFLFVRCERKCRVKDGMLRSDFFRRNVALSFQEDAIGIRLRDVIDVDNMMWGSDHPLSESTFPQSRKILAEILAGVPDDEQAKIAGGNTARVYNFDVARLRT